MSKYLPLLIALVFIVPVIGSFSYSYLNCGRVFDHIQNSKYPPDEDFDLGFVLTMEEMADGDNYLYVTSRAALNAKRECAANSAEGRKRQAERKRREELARSNEELQKRASELLGSALSAPAPQLIEGEYREREMREQLERLEKRVRELEGRAATPRASRAMGDP